MKFTTRRIAFCGLLAAMYAAVTIATASFAYGPIQFRLSEALIVLCWFNPVAAVGLTLGCFVANLFSTVTALDMVVGTAATLLGCLLTAKCRNPFLVPLPTILSNGILVGAMLSYVYTPTTFLSGFLLMGSQVALGEIAVLYILGLPLLLFLRKHRAGELLRTL